MFLYNPQHPSAPLRQFALAVLLCVASPSLSWGQTQASRPDHLDDSDLDGKLADAERDRQARDKFQEGRGAYDRGEYRDAWDLFRQAYVLSRRPALLYNVGQSADRLGLSKEALKAFRMYLRDAKEPDNRRDVENRIRALEQTVQRNKELNEDHGEAQDSSDDGGDAGASEAAVSQHDDAATDDQFDAAIALPGQDQPPREGWYFRAALGLGGLYDGVEGSDGTDISISGAALSGELLVGYRVTAEAVLGGGLLFVATTGPKRDDGAELDRANLLLFGPFIDYYLAPQTDGMHLQGGLGVGTLAMKSEGNLGDTAGAAPAGGGGIFGGVGYEWPTHEDIAVGVLARAVLASMVQDDVHDHTVFTTSVLCSATWY